MSNSVAMSGSESVLTQEARVTPYLWAVFALCFLSNVTGGAVSTLMSAYLPVVIADIPIVGGGDQEQLSAWLSALYFVGWAAGGLLMGVAGDRIGRVRSLAMAIVVFGTSTVLLRFGGSWTAVIVLRLIAGFGVGATLVLNTTLISEVWPAKTRAVFLGILSIGFPVGIFASGALTYLVGNWRDGALMGFAPLIIGTVIWLFVRESDKWQTVKTGGTNDSRAEFSQHRAQLIEGAVIFTAMLIGLWAIFAWVPTWVQSLLINSDGQRERGISMMLLGGGGLTGGFFSGWVANLLGTRRAMIMCFSLCFTLSSLLFLGSSAFTALTLVGIACLAGTFGISQGLLSVYIPQLFPVVIRARATGFCFNVGRIFTATSVFFVGALVQLFGGYGNSLFTFSCVFLVGLTFLLIRKPR